MTSWDEPRQSKRPLYVLLGAVALMILVVSAGAVVILGRRLANPLVGTTTVEPALNLEAGLAKPDAPWEKVWDKPILSLLSSRDGELYAGTVDGLYVVGEQGGEPLLKDVNVWTLLELENEGLYASHTNYVWEKPRQDLEGGGYLETEGGPTFSRPADGLEFRLVRRDAGGRWTTVMDGDAPWSLASTSDGRLLASTNMGVFAVSGAGMPERLGPPQETLCFGLLAEGGSDFSVGTWRGVWRYHEGQWQQSDGPINEVKVISLAATPDGTFAGTGAGLFRLATADRWEAVPGDAQKDALGALFWDGTRLLAGGGNGLYVLENGRTKRTRLQGKQVAALVMHRGRLCAGADDGLWCVQKDEGGQEP